MVADAVLVEPVSNENSLLTGKLTGNFVKFLRAARFYRRHSNEFSSLQQNSLLSRTGNFCEGTGNLYARTGNLNRPVSDFRMTFFGNFGSVSWKYLVSIRRNDAERRHHGLQLRLLLFLACRDGKIAEARLELLVSVR